jgi:hypothetical protein
MTYLFYLDVLQANGVAPLPPRPEEEDVKPEILEISDDEDAAEREEKALRVSPRFFWFRSDASTIIVSQKRLAQLEKNKKRNKRVKTEHRPIKFEQDANEVIDLT